MSQFKYALSKTNNNKLFKGARDRISELPDDVLSSIISLFNVRDAAKARLLSSRWGDMCASSLSVLEFTSDLMFPSNVICKTLYPFCVDSQHVFVKGVNQFLKSYHGTVLDSFKVFFCIGNESATHINEWVKFAMGLSLQNLTLVFSCNYCYYNSLIMYREPYILCSELITQCRNLSKIGRLNLSMCTVKPGVINQFSYLKALVLLYVKVDPRDIETFLTCGASSRCLEYLSFSVCRSLPPKLFISGSFHLLKYLRVDTCDGAEKIDLSATKITDIDYWGIGLVSFSFPRASTLKRICMRPQDAQQIQYIFTQFGKDLPSLENLSIVSDDNWVQHIPEHITTFGKIKELVLFSPEDIKFDGVFKILKACPFVQKLRMDMHLVPEMKGGEKIDLHLPLEDVHKNLKEMHFGGFRLDGYDVDAAKFILDYAVALERMIIDPQLKFDFEFYTLISSPACSSRMTWDEGERHKVLSSLLNHSKSSIITIL